MKIEEIEELENIWNNACASFDVYSLLEQALDALRSEAWHPIDQAEGLGAKDGREVLLVGGDAWFEKPFYIGKFHLHNKIWVFSHNGGKCDPTHFRFINLP